MTRLRKVTGSGAVVVCVFVMGTGVLAQLKPRHNSSAVDVAVKDLQSDLPDLREGAEVRLYALGPDDFPAIEAASKRNDLKPTASETLKKVVDTVRPLVGRRTRAARAADAGWQWAQRTALTSYDAVGKRNPRWDDAAREALAKAEQGGDRLEQYGALDKAVQLGCDDPLLLSLKAYFSAEMHLADPGILADDLVNAADGMMKSKYPASLTLPAVTRAGQHPGRQVYKRVNGQLVRDKPSPAPARMLQAALRLWPQVLKDPEMPEALVLKRANELVSVGNVVDNATKPTFDKVLEGMEKEPRHAYTTLIFKGSYYINYAWEARGSGFANTVTPEGFRLMGERLVVAEQALTKAYESNPNDAAAATTIMGVELGQGKGKDVMEVWFARAMKADPDNYQACINKLYYLEPKWYGSPREMLTFAHECRDSKNWYGNTPMVLVEAHDRLSRYAQKPEQYFQIPGVWVDLQSVYKPLLNAWPENAYTRSRYTYFACMCGQWAEARSQFVRLGDKAEPKAFGDDSKMEDMKQKAMNGGR